MDSGGTHSAVVGGSGKLLYAMQALHCTANQALGVFMDGVFSVNGSGIRAFILPMLHDQKVMDSQRRALLVPVS